MTTPDALPLTATKRPRRTLPRPGWLAAQDTRPEDSAAPDPERAETDGPPGDVGAPPALPAPPPEADLHTEFAGRASRLFGLAVWTGVLSILTLGFYRFWMKTRLRRWYWSAVRPGGQPLEYTGTPLEKLLGFLVAVVVLAFYIGIVNLLLMFLSFSLLANNFAAYAVSFAGVIPIYFYARYRARRYVLARTRWRGIRFGLAPGAWGYALRVALHGGSVLLTAGLLLPRMTFLLEKYMTDRTSFGSVRLNQGGHWTMLYPAMGHLLIGGFATAAILGLTLTVPRTAWLLLVFVPWLVYGIVHYSVETRRLMANQKTAGDVHLRAEPRVGRILRITVFGNLAVLVLVLVPFAPLGLAAAMLQTMQGGGTPGLSAPSLPTWVYLGAGVMIYFGVFLSWAALRHVFVTMPIWKHFAETLRIGAPEWLGRIEQRDRDEFREAEGFAEALDIGAAI